MEIKFRSGEWVNIPENCTAVVKDDIVVFEENKPKFKSGDFVFANGSQGDSILIYSGSENRVICLYFISSCRIYFDGITSSDFIRFATDSEKQLLLDKLHESGKYWDAEKCEIVDLKYVPKVGDCLKLEYEDDVVFIECSGIEKEKYPCGYETIIDCGEIYQHNLMLSGWEDHWKVTKITREELQFEFNKLGYEYDFETHAAKKIEWKPKKGDEYYSFTSSMNVHKYEWENQPLEENWYKNGSVFRTRELAEAALELLKNAKHY